MEEYKNDIDYKNIAKKWHNKYLELSKKYIKLENEVINKKIIENTRACTECNKEMTQGYCIENGEEYYCSDECLHKNYTQDEYLEMYDNGNGDSYWTEWECEELNSKLYKDWEYLVDIAYEELSNEEERPKECELIIDDIISFLKQQKSICLKGFIYPIKEVCYE